MRVIIFIEIKEGYMKGEIKMTIKEIKEMFDGDYVEVEVYKPLSTGRYYPKNFHTDNCVGLGDGSPSGDYTEDMKVGLYELMDEEDYNQSLLAGCDITADFEDWYGNRNAKILCIMIK